MAFRILRPASALAPEARESLRAFGQTGLPTRAHRIMLSVCLRQTPQRQATAQRPGRGGGWRVANGPVTVFGSPTVYDKRSKGAKKPPQPFQAFSIKDIPPRTVWEAVFERHAPGDLTIADLERTAQVYCDIAMKNISTWKGKLERDHGIDLYTLYYTGLLLLLGSGSNSPFRSLARSMILTASDLDYAPATLTFAHLAIDASKGNLDARNPVFDGLLKKLSLLARNGNPDALTLAGDLAGYRNDIPGALLSFNQAIAAAATQGDGAFAPAPTRMDIISGRQRLKPPQRKPRWAMESRCHIQRGRLLLQRGDRADAEAAFRIAATELDAATGYLELGKMLPVGSSYRELYLLKAVASGATEAHTLLASDVSSDKWTGSMFAGDNQADQRRWIDELLRLSGGPK